MPIANELNVVNTTDATTIANTMFGDGVTIVSSTLSGVSGQSGIYSGGDATVGDVAPSDTGVIFSTGNTGDITNSTGTTDTNTAAGTGTDMGGAGDADLTALGGNATEDAVVFEATFIPTGDFLTMQFTFSSEEYLEYVNGGVNDVLGVWVNGTFTPLTPTGSTVSIDTVNQAANSNLYIDNAATDDTYNTEMDGFTVTLSMKAPVNSGEENTIKIGLADGGDGVYDSNVLIAADSIQTVALAMSDEVTLETNSSRVLDVLANDIDQSGQGLTITQINGQDVVAGDTITLGTGEQVTLNSDNTVTITSDGDVTSSALTYTVEDGDGVTDVGYITINTIAAGTSTVDGIVDGGAGADIIDATYTGDPDGDLIDNNDATGVFGTVGEDDYVRGFAGDDSITSGAGNDTVFGGNDSDEIDGGAGNDQLYGGNEGEVSDLIVNGSFEDLTGTNSTTFGDQGFGSIVGWTDYSGGAFDLHTNGKGGTFATDGTHVLDMGGTPDNLHIYQDVAGIVEGETYALSFDAGDVTGGGNAVEVYWGGELVATIDPVEGGMESFDFTLIGGAGDGSNRLEFKEIGPEDVDGVQLDSIELIGVDGSASLVDTAGDTIDGGAGADEVYGLGGDDSLSGGIGNDTIYGGEGDDTFGGWATEDGDDTFFGGQGNDTINSGNGNDTVFGGTGDDVLIGASNDDTLFGGEGSDQFRITDDHESDVIEGGEDADGLDVDTVNFSNFESTQGVTVTSTGDEAGTYDFDGTVGDGSYSEIEAFIGTQYDDTFDLGADDSGVILDAGQGDDSITTGDGDDDIFGGQGADTFNTGAGNDQINLGEDSPGNPDQDPDVIILQDGFGDDIVTNFDAPTPNGDGTFTGIDTLEVSNLTDGTDPVNVNDVTVTDDGSGNAVLEFPNGETITLIGISPTDADDPFYLNAIGIPLSDGTVSGTAGADVIDGGYTGDNDGDMVDAGDAILTGDTGDDDLIEAGAGDDVISAGAGDDEVYAGTGNDTINVSAGDGSDTVEGGEDAGNGDVDTLSFTDGSGPEGVEITMSGNEAGSYDFPTDGGDGTFSEIEEFTLTDQNDSFDGVLATGGNTVDAGAGDDVLIGSTGVDSFEGGDGNDTLNANGGDDELSGGAGDDTIFGDEGEDIITGGDDSDALYGGQDNDTVDGGTGDDTVEGGDGDDTLIGGDGADTIIGGADQDVIYGGAGDVINGSETGVDFDTLLVEDVDYIDYDSGNPENGTVYFNGGGSLTFTNIETVTVTDRDGTVSGTSGDDLINSGYVGDPDGDMVDANDAILAGDVGDDDLIEAGDGNDTVISGDGDDEVYGGVGNDTVIAGLGDDTVFGEDGDDLLSAGDGTDSIYGGDGDDIINGGIGADVLEGGSGADNFVLEDNFGDDTVVGGEGGTDSDTLASLVTSDVTVVATGTEAGTLTDGTSTVTFSEIERIETADGDDAIDISADLVGLTVQAGSGDDTITGGEGDDTMLGERDADTFIAEDNFGTDTVIGGQTGNNFDTLDLSGLSNPVSVVFSGPGAGTVTDTVTGDVITFSEIEQLILTDQADVVNTAGDDGYTFIQTLGGDDSYVGSDGDDVVDDEMGTGDGDGSDTFFGGAGNDEIWAGDEDDTLSGGVGDDTLEGQGGDDDFVMEDGFGNDDITGGETGETNGDVLDGSGLTQDVTLTLTGDEVGTLDNGTDTANFDEIETFVLGAGDDTATGNVGNDYIDGGAGNDTITGGAGDDTLKGEVGDDTIAGGTGADTLTGGDGDDTLTIAEGDEAYGDDGDDLFVVEDLGEPTNGTITVDGGSGDETGGDTLQLGSLTNLTQAVKDTFVDDGTGSFSGTVTLDDGTILNFSEIENIICFTPGTRIATPQGLVAVEDLEVGDLVVTRDHGLQPIRWVEGRTVPGKDRFAPVRIGSNVLAGQERDLIVSPQHRVLFQGYRAELLFGESEVLVAATHLVDGLDVTQDERDMVTYVHMLFDQHEIIFAEGAPTESFHPGDIGFTAVGEAAREELFTIFPELRADPRAYGNTARRCLKAHEAKLIRT